MKTSLLLLALAALPVAGCEMLNSPIAPDGPDEEAAELSPEMGAILAAANAARAEGQTCGGEAYAPAPALAWDGRLERAAEVHTKDMAAREEMDHVGSDGSTVADRVSRAGYEWRRVGENIARMRVTPEGVVKRWVASAGHCANLMDPSFTEMGAAEADGFWTQVLGRPR